MKRIAILLPAILAACNSGPSVTATNASVEEVSNKVAAAQGSGNFISPGQWTSTAKVNLEMPGMDKMPPEAAQKMKDAASKGVETTTCVTEADVKSPKAAMFGGDKSCRYDHYTMAGGTIDAKLTCEAQGQKRVMTVKGTYSADSYHIESTADAGPMGKMSSTIDAKRTGECTGKEKS